VTGAITATAVLVREKTAPWSAIKNISWGVLPLVAGLFVLVEALDKTGLISAVAGFLRDGAAGSPVGTAATAGAGVAFISNVINNLPAGLIAGSALQAAHVPEAVRRAVLIGVDIGPNLSVTGSLATILWLTALRREGHQVGFATFLRLGVVVMPPALLLAIASVLLWG
jgi:arsenical pump membrane protein